MVYCSIFDFLMVILCIEIEEGAAIKSEEEGPFHEFQNPFKNSSIFQATPAVTRALLFFELFHQCCLLLSSFQTTMEDFNLLSCLGTSSSFILTRARIEMFVGGRSTKIISWMMM